MTFPELTEEYRMSPWLRRQLNKLLLKAAVAGYADVTICIRNGIIETFRLEISEKADSVYLQEHENGVE
jgi:hypothetical protein